MLRHGRLYNPRLGWLEFVATGNRRARCDLSAAVQLPAGRFPAGRVPARAVDRLVRRRRRSSSPRSALDDSDVSPDARAGQRAAPRRARRRCAWRRSRVVLFCLFRPVLVLKAAVPAAELPRRPHRRLAQHADRRLATGSRAARSSGSSSAAPDAGAARRRCRERFVLRTFRFSSSRGAARHRRPS